VVRQAHTYLVGAMGGATLIAVAIAVFVVLVSVQVFRDWPIAALGSGDESAAVSPAHPADGLTAGATAGPNAGSAASAGSGAANAKRAGNGSAGGGDLGSAGGQGTTEQGGSGTGTGGQGGSGAGSPNGSSSSPSSPGAGSGSSSSGGGSSGGGSSGGGGGNTSGTTSSPSGQVTETVNDTVSKVDESALGGTLDESGVTGVTEGAVEGVVGPESTVGKAVDETAGAVGGLLPGNP
jgi:hypothetical protein